MWKLAVDVEAVFSARIKGRFAGGEPHIADRQLPGLELIERPHRVHHDGHHVALVGMKVGAFVPIGTHQSQHCTKGDDYEARRGDERLRAKSGRACRC